MSFPRYERYKDSGVEWLGEVPDHWDIQQLKRLFEVKKRIAGVEGFDVLSITQSGIRIKDVTSNDGQLAMDYAKYQFVEPGDFAMNHMDLLTGYVDISEVHGVTSPDYRVFSTRHKEICDDFYFLRLFQNGYHRKIFYAFGQGASQFGRWRLAAEQFNEFRVPVPPIEEQLSIRRLLDRETAKIDALIEEQRRLVELLKEKRRAVISHAVAKGLNPDAPMKDSGVEWLGLIPAHWNVIPMGYLVKLFSGGTPDKTNECFWDGTVPWVSPKDMKVGEIVESQDHVTDEAVLQSGLRLFAPGHLLIVVRGMILAHTFPVATNAVPVTINQDMKAVLCGEMVTSAFLHQFLNGLNDLIVSQADESAHGTLKLESSVLSNLPVPVPPVDEQLSISNWVCSQMTTLNLLISQVDAAIQHLQERRSALISSAVTGKIDVRNYAAKEAHEPA